MDETTTVVAAVFGFATTALSRYAAKKGGQEGSASVLEKIGQLQEHGHETRRIMERLDEKIDGARVEQKADVAAAAQERSELRGQITNVVENLHLVVESQQMTKAMAQSAHDRMDAVGIKGVRVATPKRVEKDEND